jgi:hypothetical protein
LKEQHFMKEAKLAEAQINKEPSSLQDPVDLTMVAAGAGLRKPVFITRRAANLLLLDEEKRTVLSEVALMCSVYHKAVIPLSVHIQRADRQRLIELELSNRSNCILIYLRDEWNRSEITKRVFFC